LSQAKINSSIGGTLDEIIHFTGRSTGLKATVNNYKLTLLQLIDKKELIINMADMSEVINRKDLESSPFLQLNFFDGKKLLLTDQLIGFKPYQVSNLEMAKIPKVVTTPDLLNVIDALEDTIESRISKQSEADMLKRVYVSILKGAENTGFDTTAEKELYHNLVVRKLKGTS
jgi:hypothetical protein